MTLLQTRRKISIYLCHHYSGARLREIGAIFGVGESAVSQQSSRFKKKLEEDGDLKGIVEQVRLQLRNVNV
jgi:DNA-directed RNA polymerase specialized sigma subunit